MTMISLYPREDIKRLLQLFAFIIAFLAAIQPGTHSLVVDRDRSAGVRPAIQDDMPMQAIDVIICNNHHDIIIP